MTHRRVAILDDQTCDRCRLLDGIIVDTTNAHDVAFRIPPEDCDHEHPGTEKSCRCITVPVEGKLAAWWRRWSPWRSRQ